MIKDFRLVICDIDSTLITSKRILTERAKEVIRRLHDHGVYFGIASGRSIDQQLHKQARDWGFDFDFEVLIGMNGSELWDGVHQKRYDYYKLKRAWIKEILELMAPFNLNPFMYVGDKMMCLRVDEATERSSKKNRTDLLVVDNISEFYAEENAKIMFRMPEELMPEVVEYVSKHPSPNFKAFKTQTTMLEFTDRRVSKAVALKQYCEMNQLPLEEVIAFGDMSNDNEMLECSGWGVCMANGSEDTKAIADDITEKTNDEDGFADYMEKHFLLPRGW
ncbi:HAD family hydrolase [Holdemania filiformis]|uniref:HAD family hydrolase n=1 Tax=Holdemania filiformis TaxID=61171 RepID=UPI00266F3A78|nr:HAD family hydrolase [Holdemania filiformis]